MTDYDTFKDIKDEKLKTRNRAVVMANIYEDNAFKDGITPAGAALLFGYFKQIPDDERAIVFEAFKENMAERGFNYGG